MKITRKMIAVRRTIFGLVAFAPLFLGACDAEEMEGLGSDAEWVESEPSAIAERDEIDFELSTTSALVSAADVVIDGLEPVGYDEERAVYVYDRDGDGWPDISEEEAGTDMFDPQSTPGLDWDSPNPATKAGFPTASCRSGYRQVGPRLCISTTTQNAKTYPVAESNCRNKRGRVCSYEDLTYLYLNSSYDATYNPSGKHLGGMTGDDQILCGNKSITYNGDPDWANFDGHCSKKTSRPYWCCHDDM